MKIFIWLILVFNLLLLSSLKSQTIDHPTIEKLEVSYKNIEITQIAGTEDAKYHPQLTIQLKNEVTVSKLYFKMINESNSSVLIDVNYLLNSMPAQDQSGKIVFHKDEQGYHIISSVQVSLNTYLFQLITEDQQGNQSIIFSEAH